MEYYDYDILFASLTFQNIKFRSLSTNIMVVSDSSQRLCHFFVLWQLTTKEEGVDTTAEVVSRETAGPRNEIKTLSYLRIFKTNLLITPTYTNCEYRDS